MEVDILGGLVTVADGIVPSAFPASPQPSAMSDPSTATPAFAARTSEPGVSADESLQVIEAKQAELEQDRTVSFELPRYSRSVSKPTTPSEFLPHRSVQSDGFRTGRPCVNEQAVVRLRKHVFQCCVPVG